MAKDGWIRIGLKNCRHSEHTFKVSAMIIRGGKILAVAYNSNKTDPVFSKRPELNYGMGPTKKINKLHAETQVIGMVSPDLLKGSTMVVIRASARKGLGLSRPCKSCAREIRKAGIRKVYYSLDYGGMACERF